VKSMDNPALPESCLSSLALKVENTILKHRLLEPGQRILVAVSGGPDSVALLGVLWELRLRWAWELKVAHVHHGLRAQDAEEELAFVQNMAQALGLDFLLRRAKPGSLKIPGRSLQESAREARYRFLEEMALAAQSQAIALGHQADDQAETVLAALIRGAGLRGLAAMPYRNGLLVRPLLEVGREEILGYLQERGMSFRIDPSNQDSRYLRVRIRHELLPFLRKRFNEAIRDVLCRTARLCALEDDYLGQALEPISRALLQKEGGGICIPLKDFQELPRALRLRLLRLGYAGVKGSTRGLGLKHAEAMDDLAFQQGPERWLDLPGNIRFGVSGGKLLLLSSEQLERSPFSYRLIVPGQTRVPEAGLSISWDVLELKEGLPEKSENEILMDMDAIQEPMVLRSPAPGDRLRPQGLGGSKKVQDLLVDAHVPRRQRWRVPILADQRGVLWVVGHRLDQRVSLGPSTRRVLRARVITQA
jgi:tRNA(Ile)-lysidine synthase